MSKRPFLKLKGTSKANDQYAVANNRRPFVFGMTFPDGGTVWSEGSVIPEHNERLAEIFIELHRLAATPTKPPTNAATGATP